MPAIWAIHMHKITQKQMIPHGSAADLQAVAGLLGSGRRHGQLLQEHDPAHMQEHDHLEHMQEHDHRAYMRDNHAVLAVLEPCILQITAGDLIAPD